MHDVNQTADEIGDADSCLFKNNGGTNTAHPAATKTIFFRMYCPSSVGANGEILNVNSGSTNNGTKVPAIWNKNSTNARRIQMLNINATPKTHSMIAR